MRNTLFALAAALTLLAGSGCAGNHCWGRGCSQCDSCEKCSTCGNGNNGCGCQGGCGYCGPSCGACGPNGCPCGYGQCGGCADGHCGVDAGRGPNGGYANGEYQNGDCPNGQCGGNGPYAGGPYCGRMRPPCSPVPDCYEDHQAVASQLGGPAGPSCPQVTYPYYTVRGPRDFLAAHPPSIGP
jgi:hypothetical protein